MGIRALIAMDFRLCGSEFLPSRYSQVGKLLFNSISFLKNEEGVLPLP